MRGGGPGNQATPPERGGVGLVGLSGRRAVNVARQRTSLVWVPQWTSPMPHGSSVSMSSLWPWTATFFTLGLASCFSASLPW